MKTSSEITKAIELLKGGEVVAVPTETVYGLAASIANEDALKKIFRIKQRPFFDPLIVHVADIIMAKSLVAQWPSVAELLAKKFWPGPLTLVLPKNSQVSNLITSGLETVAIRVPQHSLALQLINAVGPLAAPSANRFGRTSPTSAQHVRDEFGENVFVVEGGNCEGGLESTVIEVGDGLLNILRPGLIARESIIAALKTTGFEDITVGTFESNKSPGHLEHHYQPKVELVFFKSHDAKVKPERVLCELKSIAQNLKRSESFLELKLSAIPQVAARELYSELRRLSDCKPSLIFVTLAPGKLGGVWDAIYDRLKRAAAFYREI